MVLSGKPVAEALQHTQKQRVAASGKTPHLVIIQAGDDLASTTYIKMKQHYGQSIGAQVDHIKLSGDLEELLSTINTYNHDDSVDGIIIQLPLPDTAITDQVVTAIAPAKDVDGLGPSSRFESATAMAVLELLKFYKVPIKNTLVAMVGRGRLVGKPLIRLLKDLGATVDIHGRTTSPEDLTKATRAAQLVISSTGVPGIIKPGMISDGSTVIDVGTAEDAGAIVGDVDPTVYDNPAINYTPAKGGVGPITVSILFEQLLKAAKI